MTDDHSVGLRSGIRTEAENVEEDSRLSARGHFEAAGSWEKRHLWIGIPATGLAAIAGVSAFAEFEILSGIVALSVATLTALFTFLNPSGRASGHLSAGNAYKALQNDVRIFYQIECRQTIPIDEQCGCLKELNDRRNELNRKSPQIPRWAYKRAKMRIEAGEDDYATDAGK